MAKPDFEKYLQKGKWIRLVCAGSSGSVDEGEVGEVAEDSFEFLVVRNSYEHFSNNSAPPEYRKYTILKKDVVEISGG